MRRPLPYAQRHEYPVEFRRQLTIQYARERGLGELAQQPLPYSRWEWPASVGATLGLFLGVGALGGFAARDELALWIPLLWAFIAWAACVGLPWLLPQGIAGAVRRRRLRAASAAMPGYRDSPGTRPGQAGQQRGWVTYHDGWIRVLTPQGQAVGIPFASVHLAEELPPKGLWGFPGIDVLSRSGEWTEIRLTDKAEIVAVLQQAGVPMLRAVKR